MLLNAAFLGNLSGGGSTSPRLRRQTKFPAGLCARGSAVTDLSTLFGLARCASAHAGSERTFQGPAESLKKIMPTLVSVFGVAPRRIGGTEMFARELSAQLGRLRLAAACCVFCPSRQKKFVAFLSCRTSALKCCQTRQTATGRRDEILARILKKHQPEILHLHFVSFLTLYPWVARFNSVRKVFFTDHHSRPAGHIPTRAPLWKQAAARIIGLPLSKVVCVSNYGYQCMTGVDLLPRKQVRDDLQRCGYFACRPGRRRGLRHFAAALVSPKDRQIVTQVCWMIPEKGISDFLGMARAVAATESQRAICPRRRRQSSRAVHERCRSDGPV